MEKLKGENQGESRHCALELEPAEEGTAQVGGGGGGV